MVRHAVHGLILLIAISLAPLRADSWAPPHSDPAIPADSTTPPLHHWQYIEYPFFEKDGRIPGSPLFLLSSAEQGLQITVFAPVSNYFDNHRLTARIHRSDGTVLDLTPEEQKDLTRPIGITTAGLGSNRQPDYQTNAFFPWGPNTLGESWIELNTGKETYWLEMPYGFDRNPNDPLPPAQPGGAPQLAPAMKNLTVNDHIVHWRDVQYDLGTIQQGWELGVHQTNSDDTRCNVGVYQGMPRVGWSPTPPNLAVALSDLDNKAAPVNGTLVPSQSPSRVPEKGHIFQLDCPDDNQRGWGKIVITVNDKSYRLVVPSSVYKHGHGHAAVK